jgi:hypothetical protein
MKIATKTPGHKVTQKVLISMNPLCLRAFVAKFSFVSGRGRGIMIDCPRFLYGAAQVLPGRLGPAVRQSLRVCRK